MMANAWRRQWRAYAACLLVLVMLLELVVPSGTAVAEEEEEPEVVVTFDAYTSVAAAGLDVGGGLAISNLSLDAAVYRGADGKSVKIAGRTQVYNRLKLPNLFDGVTMEEGDHFNLSLWAKVGAGSSVETGYFFLSVITYPGSKQEGDPPYYQDKINHKFLVGQDGWTQITLPYVATGDPVYGLAIEQVASGSLTAPVQIVHIDDVEVYRTAPPPPATSKLISFDDVQHVAEADIGVGGAQNLLNVELDSSVYRGAQGQSLHIKGRTALYNRIKLNAAFSGMDLTPGTQYDISLYARSGGDSIASSGYFYLSVVDIEGALNNRFYYNDKDNYNALVTADDWVKVTLPFTVGMDPIYGIAFEQMAVLGYENVVSSVYIDDVEIVKTGFTTEIPPPREDDAPVTVVIDGRNTVFVGSQPEVRADIPYVPALKLFSMLKAHTDWDILTETLAIVKDGTSAEVTIGEASATIGGASILLEAPAIIVDGQPLVPASFAEQVLQADVAWDAVTKLVTVESVKVNVITIDKNGTRQEIWGFGATANEPAYDLMNGDGATAALLLDKFFGTDEGEAGLTITRLEINPFTKADADPRKALQASIQPAQGVWDFDTDAHQRWFADEATDRNPDMRFAASVWSPPAWMKDNGSATHGGRLKPEHYEDYAAYLLAWAKKYKEEYGYNVSWLSIQNEPSTLVEYASAIYSEQEMSDVASVVYDTFQADGIDVWIGAPEGGHVAASQRYLQMMDPAVLAKLDFVATHFYAWDRFDASNYDLRTFGKPMFMMEYCLPAPNDIGIGGALTVAEQINLALEQGYSSYLYWLYVSKPSPPGSVTTRESLVDLKTDGTYTINKRLYAMGQYSRFIRPGHVKLDAASGNSDVTVTASKDPATGEAVLVAANRSTSAITMTVQGLDAASVEVYRTSATEDIASVGSQSVASGTMTVTLAPRSVTTFVE